MFSFKRVWAVGAVALVGSMMAVVATAAVDVVAARDAGAAPIGEDTFRPLTPARLLDTRIGVGALAVKLGPGATLVLQVTGQGGVPVSGVGAVSVNITATQPTTGSYLTVWPTGLARPNASTLNFGPGQTIANSTVVGVSADGKISLFNASGSTHVVVDVSGWFPSGGFFTALAPARLLDTRFGVGAPAVKLGPGATLVLQVTGRGGVPATGVGAVSVNITAAQPTMGSYLTVWPTGIARPEASTLNVGAGETIANATVVGVSADGKISLYNASGSTHVVVDVSGWFQAGEAFTALAPARLLDTRFGVGASPVKLGPGASLDLQVTGRGGVPATNVGAVSVNITATEPDAGSFVTVWQTGRDRFKASILNFPSGQTIANSTIVGVSADGKISLYNWSGSAHLVVDVSGWFPRPPDPNVSQISVGLAHSCGVVEGGAVKCWGLNSAGRLGDGTIAESRLTPVSVVGLSGAIQVSAADEFTCALLADGTVKCWGANHAGALGDGTITYWATTTPVSVSGLTDATQIAGGGAFACAIVAGGAVKCWGRNSSGQLGDGTTTDRLTPVTVSGLTGATQIVAGYGHACAIVAGGAVKCWGRNKYGQLGDGTTTDRLTPVTVSGLTGATQISAALHHVCALLSDGTAKCWGPNSSGQLGDGTTTDRLTPVTVSGITGATQFATGSRYTPGQGFTCVLVAGGAVKCWGKNDSGQLGDGTTTDRLTPVTVSGLTGATQIDAGVGTACAIVVGGAVKCWGANPSGQLGDGTTTDRLVPVSVVWW